MAFSSHARSFGGKFDYSFPTCTFFSLFLMEISLCTLILTLYARLSPQWPSELWPNVPWQVACELISGQVPTLCLGSGIVDPLQWHSQSTPTSLGQGVCMFQCNLAPALFEEWTGSFTCHCSNTGVEQTPNMSQHIKLTLEKKILLLLLPGFKLATFQSRIWRFYQQAIPGC